MTISVLTFTEQTYEELFGIVKQHVERKPTIDLENAFVALYPKCDRFYLFFPFQTMYMKEYLRKFILIIVELDVIKSTK